MSKGYEFLNVILEIPEERIKIQNYYLAKEYAHNYPDILWESRAFCEAALIKQKSCLYKVPLEFRDYKMCKLAVSLDGDNIKSVPENIENYYSLCEIAVSQRGWSLMLIDKNKWDYNLCEKAVSQNGGVLFYIPEKYRDYNLCEKAVSSEPSSIYDVPKNIENYYSLIKLAYSKDKTVIFMNLPKEYFDKLKKDFPNDFPSFNKDSLNENKSLLKEGITDEVYHFTSLENLIRILKSNSLNLSFMDNDINQTWNRKDSNIHKTLNKYMYFLSLSRTKSIDKGYAQVLTLQRNTPVIARIKLDGRKLSYNNRIIPFDYNYFINSNAYKNLKNFEYEDRLVSDKSSIKNINDYILEIDIFMYYNYDFQKDSFLFLKEYQNTTNIPIKVFNKVKNNSLNESKSLLKEEYTEEEVLEELSDKHKLDINSLNKFLIENNDPLLEYLLFDNSLLDVEKNIMNIVKNKYITGFGSIPVKSLYQPKVIKEIIFRNPELLVRLNLGFLDSMKDSKQEMKDVYKYAVINKPIMLRRIPTNLEYYNELLEAIYKKDSQELFDMVIWKPKNEHQRIYLGRVISFLENKGYILRKNNSLQESKQPFKRKTLLN
jgi:hypothetical protein